MLKRAFPLLAIPIFIMTVSADRARAEHPDFTGSWVLDASTSTFSGNAPSAGTLLIQKHGKTLHIAESFTYANGEKAREFEWKTDDRFHPVGAGEGEVLAKWDHDSLVGERRTGEGVHLETVRFAMRDASSMAETVVRPDSQSAIIWRRK